MKLYSPDKMVGIYH